MVHLWLSALLSLFAGNAAQAAPLNLRDAILYAAKNSPALDSAEREALIISLEKRSAGAAFLPTLDLNSTHGLRKTFPRTETNPWVSSLSLDLNETLYDNGQSITRFRTAKLREEESRIRFLQTRDRLFLEIALEFYRHGQAVKNFEIQKEQHEVLRKQYQLTESGYRQGIKTRKDFLRFKTQLSRSEIDLVNSSENVNRSRQELRRLLGVPLASADQPDFVVDESKPRQVEPAQIPLEGHRDYEISQIQEKIDRLEEIQSRRRLWPELSLTAGASYGSSGYIGPGSGRFTERDSANWNASLGLKYNLLDWGTRSRDAQIAFERREIAGNTRTNQLLSLRLELDRLTTDFRQLKENFRLGEELLNLERRNFEVLASDYRQGKADYLDYITSLRELAAAKTSYYSSLFDLKRGILSQKFHQGTLYETILGD